MPDGLVAKIPTLGITDFADVLELNSLAEFVEVVFRIGT
jgi:hypothetical protein